MTTPLTGLVVLGSNGEAPQLDDAEADRIIDIVRAGVPVGRPLIAGTGRESTKATRRSADVRLRRDGRRVIRSAAQRSVRQVKADGAPGAVLPGAPAGHCGRIHHPAPDRRRAHARSSSAWSPSRSSSWCPGSLGRPPRAWPPATSAGPPPPETVKVAVEKLGLNDPLVVQYGRFVKGIVVGADYDSARASRLPGALLRLLLHHPASRSGRRCWTGSPVTLSLADRRRDHLAGHRGRHRRAVRAETRQRSSTGPP